MDEKNKNVVDIFKSENLNTRQEGLINDLFLNKVFYLTIPYIVNKYKITRETASNDLKDLENKKLLTSKKVGREIRYYKNS